MLEDINKALEQLIKAKTGITNISFASPDNDFSKSFVSPTVNIFLYDIREDTDFRSYKPNYRKRHDDLVQFTKGVSFSYIITVWSNPMDEPPMLSSLIKTLIYCQHLPEDYITKDENGKNKNTELAKIGTLPKIQVLHPSYLQGLGEFWSAMGGKPKPMIHCTITIPVCYSIDADADKKITPITTVIGTVISKDSSNQVETKGILNQDPS